MLSTRPKLNMSFTVGSLLARESLLLLELYRKHQDWSKAKTEAVETNILQTNKTSSCQRIVTELYSRLKLLKEEELALLDSGSSHDQQHILWLAFCRKYLFAYSFATEIIRDKLSRANNELADIDFKLFYEAQELTHPELEKISERQKNRLRQVLFRTMKEANIIDKHKMIQPTTLNDDLLSLLSKNNKKDLLIYPLII